MTIPTENMAIKDTKLKNLSHLWPKSLSITWPIFYSLGFEFFITHLQVLQETNPTIPIMTRLNIIPVKPKLIGNNNITLPTIQFTTANTVVIEELLLALALSPISSLLIILLLF